MTSVRTVPSAVALVTFAGAALSGVIPAIARADPVGHQVTYTVTTTSDLMANIRYMSADPPSMAAFNADSFGQVVVSQDGGSGVQCSTRPW